MTMKQRITVEQLSELTDEQKERLREWWKPVYGDFFSNGHWANIIQSEEDGSIRCVSTDQDGAYDYESKKDCLPLLSIGQMIELLESKKPTLHIDKHLKQGLMESDRYDVFQQGFGTSHGSTLCDALWEAVKQIL